MKQLLKNYKTIAIGMATVMTVGFTNVSNAQSTKEVPALLTYVGTNMNQPVFQLDLNNSEVNDLTILVKDASGVVLYSERIKAEKISRRFKLDAEDMELVAGTTFEVVNKTSNESITYKINNSTHLVQNVVIDRL
jgi:hypothetical protein